MRVNQQYSTRITSVPFPSRHSDSNTGARGAVRVLNAWRNLEPQERDEAFRQMSAEAGRVIPFCQALGNSEAREEARRLARSVGITTREFAELVNPYGAAAFSASSRTASLVKITRPGELARVSVDVTCHEEVMQIHRLMPSTEFRIAVMSGELRGSTDGGSNWHSFRGTLSIPEGHRELMIRASHGTCFQYASHPLSEWLRENAAKQSLDNDVAVAGDRRVLAFSQSATSDVAS